VDIAKAYGLIALLTLPAFFFGLYTYMAADQVVTAFRENKNQKLTDHWLPLLSVSVSLGWFGGWATYITIAGMLDITLANAVTSNLLTSGLAGSLMSTWLTMKSVRHVISCHYPGTTFATPHYFFIKELGPKRERATPGLRWVNNLL
jgi:hypothetical protein